MMKSQPTFIMLVGLPASGKSTLRRALTMSHQIWGFSRNLTCLSTDDLIENYAYTHGLTYDQAFEQSIKDATKQMYFDLERAIDNNHDIILDQTNLTVKSRLSKLGKIPNYYHKRCNVVFNKNEEQLQKRLMSREGKTIPDSVMSNMKVIYVNPSITEGFDDVYYINTEDNNFLITHKEQAL